VAGEPTSRTGSLARALAGRARARLRALVRRGRRRWRRALDGLQRRARAAGRHLRLARSDRARNRRWTLPAGRFLVLRDSRRHADLYEDFLRWLEASHPGVRARLELRLLPCRVRDWSRYALCVPWLQDPVQEQSPWAYAHTLRLERSCRENGVPVINPVDRIALSPKSVSLPIIASTGIRTARVEHLDPAGPPRDLLERFPPPFFVREDRRHAGPTFTVLEPDDFRRVPLGRFRHPIAVEFIDTRSPHDGLHRKYRYLAVGERGIARHLMLSKHWEVRGPHRIATEAAVAEELAHVNAPDPNHERLQRARRALGLDVVAFDYSYDPEGGLVVWEPNPFPDLGYPRNPARAYLIPSAERTFAAVAALYLERAGLPVPEALAVALPGASPAGG
jgi:hypothetical protein